MAKFCSNCGAELMPGKAFCHECGAKVVASTVPKPTAPTPPALNPASNPFGAMPQQAPPKRAVPKQVQPMPVRLESVKPESVSTLGSGSQMPNDLRMPQQTSPQQFIPQQAVTPIPAQPQERKLPTKSKGSTGLAVFLSLVMVVEGCVAGFKYPGWFKKENKPQTGDVGTQNSGTATPTGNPGEAASFLLTEDFPLRYSADDLASAPAVTADVSVMNPDVQAGGTRILSTA